MAQSMSAEITSKQCLPSPPVSLNGEHHQGIEQLLQHNATTPYRSEQYGQDNSGYVPSGHSAAYESPNEIHWQVDQHLNNNQQFDRHDQRYDGDKGSPYDWYCNPVQNQPSPYHVVPAESMTRRYIEKGEENVAKRISQYTNQSFGAVSPPTPTMSDLSNSDFRTTRSGRPIVLNRSLRGEQRSTPEILGKSSKKITKQKGRDKQKIPKLDAPLSVLTEEYKHIPMKDMDAWVNRSSEVRNKEVEKRNGYVTRPMNSFMLYRSAYADRCKIWCLQNNHQVVSSVCGSSWPMEPPEVREQFNEYARIERDNHQKAHPGYKFSPSKAQSSARKRKGASEDTDGDEASDHEDPDFDWRPAGGRRARGRTAIRSGREAGYPISNMLGIEANYGLNASSYQTVNPGKPMPAAMSDQELYSQYYQTSVRQSSNVPNVEDVYIRKTPMPGTQSGNAPPLIALPGAHHYELLDQNTFDNNQVVEEPQVDPTLLAFDNGFAQQTNSFITEQQFQDFNDESLFGIATQNYEHHGGQDVYGMQQMPWHFGEPQPRSGEDDFERWMAEKNDR